MYLVAGGFYVDDDFVSNYLDSTEIYTDGGSSWVDAEPLPQGAIGLQGVSVDNKIFMTGKRDSSYMYILKLFFMKSRRSRNMSSGHYS